MRENGKVKKKKIDELKKGIEVDGVFYGRVEEEIERVKGENVWI